MKKTIISLFAVAALLVSCTSNGKKAETGDAETIKSEANADAVAFSKIAEGSNIAWKASHLAGAEPRWGKVFYKSADVTVKDNSISAAVVVIDMPSLTVENFGDDAETTAKLSGHLKSDDFFKTESFPTSSFELSSIKPNMGDYNSIITGNLSILGVTKSISFSANVTINEENVSIKSENFAIDRRDWGLTYNTEGTENVPINYLIANEIGYTIDVTVSK